MMFGGGGGGGGGGGVVGGWGYNLKRLVSIKKSSTANVTAVFM